MADAPATNAAVKQRRARIAFLNRLEQAPDTVEVTDDFVFEDRRRATGGVSFGRYGRSDFLAAVRSTWEIGPRPRLSMGPIIGVRGERSAAVVERIDFEDGSHLEQISVVQLDATLRQMRRRLAFDVDDTSSAIDALDQLHAEIDDSPSSRGPPTR